MRQLRAKQGGKSTDHFETFLGGGGFIQS